MTEFSKKKIRFWLGNGTSECQKDEYPLVDFIAEEEWCAMTRAEKDKALENWADEWSGNYLDLGAYVDD